MDLDDPLHYTDCPPFVANYDDLKRVSNPLMRIARACFIFARITKQVCASFLSQDVTIPFGGLAMQPFDVRVMLTVICMLSGPSTGVTFFGRMFPPPHRNQH